MKRFLRPDRLSRIPSEHDISSSIHLSGSFSQIQSQLNATQVRHSSVPLTTNGRVQTTLTYQQNALVFLKARAVGTLGDARYNSEAKRDWFSALFAKRYKVCWSKILKWKPNATAKMVANTSFRSTQKIKLVKSGHFTDLKLSFAVYSLSQMK